MHTQQPLLDLAVSIAHRAVWAQMTTVDSCCRPRSRVVHPVWARSEAGLVGWLTTRRSPLKERHLAANPHVSIAYLAANHDLAYFDCVAEWMEDSSGKQACWDAFLNAPEPASYDPATIWPDGPAAPTFEALRFRPYRVQAALAADIAAGNKPRMARLDSRRTP